MAQRNPTTIESERLSNTGRVDEGVVNTGSTYTPGLGTADTAGTHTTTTTTTTKTTGTGSTGGGVKGVLAGIHGVGEKVRGEFNKNLDGALGDREGVVKNEAIANAGDRERLTGTFAGETKNREGAIPGADGGRRY